VSALYPAGMSPEAERLTFLRLQRVDLQLAAEHLTTVTAALDGRSKEARMAKTMRCHAVRVDELLRDLGNFIITGRYA
jgi:hypothetical protein